MNKEYWLLKAFKGIGLTLILGASLTACGAGKTSWKEEVLLHDGSKIIVERTQIYGGNHELGQSPVKEEIASFKMQDSEKIITWKSEYTDDVGRSNFNLRAIHALKGTPYIVAEPNLCLSYNKWGRPNPPYVVFKYDGNSWQRIKLEELPKQFTAYNVVQDTYYYKNNDDHGAWLLDKLGYITANKVKELNGRPEFNIILREPAKIEDTRGIVRQVRCEVMVRFKDGEYSGWTTKEGFEELQSLRKQMKAQPVELIK